MQKYMIMLIGVLGCQSAYPIDCSGPERGEQIIFEGSVIKATPMLEQGEFMGVDVTFKVTKPIKGALGGEVTIFTPPLTHDGYPFLCNKSYRVYARKQPQGLQTNTCYPTTPLSPGVKPEWEIEKFLESNVSEKQKRALTKQMLCP